MGILINPGTGPVDAATEENARAAMRLLLEDLAADSLEAAWPQETLTSSGDGRWAATITVNGKSHKIDMPGCAPEITREGRPWVSPRLYVDGSSWLWGFALDILGDEG